MALIKRILNLSYETLAKQILKAQSVLRRTEVMLWRDCSNFINISLAAP